MRKGIFLLILDGFGIGNDDISNPVYLAKMPYLNNYYKKFPLGTLQASGTAVGLYWNEAGNCEVGHLTLGIGRTIFQDYLRLISLTREENFFENQKLKDAFIFAKENSSSVHLIAPLSSNIHLINLDLLKLTLDLAKRINVDLYLNFIATEKENSFLKIFQSQIKPLLSLPVRLSKIIGSRYAFDSERNWLVRTKVAFDLFTKSIGKKVSLSELEDYLIKNSTKIFDQDIEPLVIEEKSIEENDVVLFFALKESDIFQLSKALFEDDEEFKFFERKLPQNLYVLSISQLPLVKPKYQIINLLEPIKIETHLVRELYLNDKNIFKITDNTKAIPLNFHFNGQILNPYPNEYRKILPTVDIQTNPLLNTVEIFDNVIQAILDDVYEVIIANIPLPDILGHYGDLNLAVKSLTELDRVLNEYIEKIISYNWIIILTSDHGNVEKMLWPESGKIQKVHDPNPVPFLIIKKGFEREKSTAQVNFQLKNPIGTLADVAPTILWFLDLPKPDWMLGKSLINFVY